MASEPLLQKIEEGGGAHQRHERLNLHNASCWDASKVVVVVVVVMVVVHQIKTPSQPFPLPSPSSSSTGAADGSGAPHLTSHTSLASVPRQRRPSRSSSCAGTSGSGSVPEQQHTSPNRCAGAVADGDPAAWFVQRHQPS